MVKYYSIALILLLFVNSIQSQTSEDQFLFADDLVEDGNFHKALSIYLNLLSEDPQNANLNFKIGYCYLNTSTEKSKSITYLESASKQIADNYRATNFKETGAPLEVLFYLGKAYHVNYRIDDAEKTFLDLKKKLGSNEEEFTSEIDHELDACRVARVLIKHPIEMDIMNLGANVNSKYAEHSPVISGDESILVFTSKREGNTGNKIMDDGQYFEDIYISSFDGEKYTKSQKISKNINTSGHEASIGLSFDGTQLFIYKDNDGNGDIYVSKRKGSEWLAPEKLPEPINSKYRETHASMSIDKNEIFFTSDRKGGYGGLDIYRVRKLPNGKWSKAQNMGPTINTEFDEEGPYLHPDGTSLFFSSKGHNTMGGYDIFISYISDNDKWSAPKNIGYPVNTPDDDVYYMPSVDGRRAYYASYAHNSIGNYDLFKINLSDAHVRNQTVIAGFAISPNNIMLENGIITITDFDDEVVGIYTPDSETKKFLFILPRGRTFNALFESSNEDDFEYTITVPNFSYDQTKRVVIFNEIIGNVDNDPDVFVETVEDNISDKDKLQADVSVTPTVSDDNSEAKEDDTSSSSLLVASELYNEGEYIESTIKSDTIEEIKEDNTLVEKQDTSLADNQNSSISDLNDGDNDLGKKTITLKILLSLIFIGFAIYFILRRKKR